MIQTKTAISRREILVGCTATMAVAGLPLQAAAGQPKSASAFASQKQTQGEIQMGTITTKDGTSIFYEDWGTGPTVVFSHGWPLNADAWNAQMLFLGQQGYRVVAHDRRGKSDKNPGGLPMSVFDGIRSGLVADRSQFYKDVSMPFYGYNKPDAKLSQGVRDAFWLYGMQSSVVASYECVKAFSETDFTDDLKQFEVPTLIIHGDADQIVPISDSAELSSKIVKNATLKVIPGAPHGLYTTHGSGQRLVARLSQGIVTRCARRWDCE
jgi:pimeloyl-ACP methyl ester carboxylesterase